MAMMFKIGEGLAIILFAIVGAHFSIKAGRLFADGSDMEAALFIGVGILLLAMAVKRI